MRYNWVNSLRPNSSVFSLFRSATFTEVTQGNEQDYKPRVSSQVLLRRSLSISNELANNLYFAHFTACIILLGLSRIWFPNVLFLLNRLFFCKILKNDFWEMLINRKMHYRWGDFLFLNSQYDLQDFQRVQLLRLWFWESYLNLNRTHPCAWICRASVVFLLLHSQKHSITQYRLMNGKMVLHK